MSGGKDAWGAGALRKQGFYETYIKRGQDILLSGIALLLLWPLLLVVAVLVRVKLGSPVIFKQERLGYQKQVFTLYKFRTMTDARDENGDLLSDEVRLTKFGKLLRSTSLDELPELWNILMGDLSLVGPRPLLVEYGDRYTPEQDRRHEVRPGLSGLAQVNGRNAISWEEKFRFDVQYVDHVTFLMDWKILFQTVGNVLKREGISAENAATVQPFMGTKEQVEREYVE